MYSRHQQRYQQQSIATASPERLVLKLYDLGITSCRRDDRAKLREVLVELISSLDFERGGEIAEQLYSLYEFCLRESALGDLEPIQDILEGLRDAWNQSVVQKQAA
jgi:flagellar protein FliS